MQSDTLKIGDKLYHSKWKSFVDYGYIFVINDDGSFFISHGKCGIPQYDDSIFKFSRDDLGVSVFKTSKEATERIAPSARDI